MMRVIALDLEFDIMGPTVVVELKISIYEVVCLSRNVFKLYLGDIHALSESQVSFVHEITIFAGSVCSERRGVRHQSEFSWRMDKTHCYLTLYITL